MDEIKQKIDEREKDGYKYSNILCISCVSRYIAFIGSENFEKTMLNEELPNVTGFYAFGEIGPLIHGGKLYNRLNNASILICAI